MNNVCNITRQELLFNLDLIQDITGQYSFVRRKINVHMKKIIFTDWSIHSQHAVRQGRSPGQHEVQDFHMGVFHLYF